MLRFTGTEAGEEPKALRPESGECRMSSDMRHEKTAAFNERISIFRSDIPGRSFEMIEVRGFALSGEFVSNPTPFGGRRDASSGRGRAGSVSGKTNNKKFASVHCDSQFRKTGNSSLSQPGGAHAAGGQSPPRASKKNQNTPLKTGYPLLCLYKTTNSRIHGKTHSLITGVTMVNGFSGACP